MKKVVFTRSGELQLTEISPSDMDEIYRSDSREVSGVPMYWCGDRLWPKNVEGWAIVSRETSV